MSSAIGTFTLWLQWWLSMHHIFKPFCVCPVKCVSTIYHDVLLNVRKRCHHTFESINYPWWLHDMCPMYPFWVSKVVGGKLVLTLSPARLLLRVHFSRWNLRLSPTNFNFETYVSWWKDFFSIFWKDLLMINLFLW